MKAIVKTIIFNDYLNYETVPKLINEIQEALSQETIEFIKLYFSSEGGKVDCAELLVDFLNTPYIQSVVGITAFSDLSSCAFTVYARFQGGKKILSQVAGVFHLMEITTGTREETKKHFNLKAAKKDLDRTNNEYISMLEVLEMDKDLISLIKEGEDVILYGEDIQKLKWENYVEK